MFCQGVLKLKDVGQAAHWFDHEAVWKELRRVVRPKGTVAYWVRDGLGGFLSLTEMRMMQGYGDMACHLASRTVHVC
jgi:hypothetical protein